MGRTGKQKLSHGTGRDLLNHRLVWSCGQVVRTNRIACLRMRSCDIYQQTSVAVIGVARTVSRNSSLTACSDEIVAMTLLSSSSWRLLMKRDGPLAWSMTVVLQNFISKSYTSRMADHVWRRLAAYVEIPAFDPKMVDGGLWSVSRVKCRPWRNL